MLTLRCTAKTLKRFGLVPEDEPPASTGRLGDWYANLLNLGTRRYVLCVSERTLLPVIVPARREEFPRLFIDHLGTMLSALEIPNAETMAETAEALDVAIARTASRSVLGVMNSMAHTLEHIQAQAAFADDPSGIAVWLSGMLHGSLADGTPAAATRALFELEGAGPARTARFDDLLEAPAGPTAGRTGARSHRPARATALRLTLTLEDVEPPIWRRLIVDERTTLSDLHRILQVVMGWHDVHLFEFAIGGVRYEDPDPEAEGRNAKRARIADLSLSPGEAFLYTYDFGDDWRCEIRVEERLEFDPRVARLPYREAGGRAGPPEDVGGPWGLADLLEALNDPAHPEHASYREWVGEHYDPEQLDLRVINGLLWLAAGWGAIGPQR